MNFSRSSMRLHSCQGILLSLQKALLCNPCLRNELSPFSQEGHRAATIAVEEPSARAGSRSQFELSDISVFGRAQQPYEYSKIHDGKCKGAVGLRRVVREYPDKPVESLHQTHDQRHGSNRVARAKPDATQHGNEQSNATRGRIEFKTAAARRPK